MRIRKSRWIGMEGEVEQLEMMLAEFTQRTGWWSVVGSLDCAIPTRLSQLHPSHGDKRRSLWTTIRNRKVWLKMSALTIYDRNCFPNLEANKEGLDDYPRTM